MAAANVVAIVVQLVSASLFTRLLIPADYGRYSYIWAWIGILSVLSLPGMTSAVSRAASLGFDGSLVPATRTRLRWGLLGVLPLGCGAVYFAAKGQPQMAFGFSAAAVVFPVYNAFENYSFFLAGKQQFGRQALWRVATLVVSGLTTWGALVFIPRVDVLILVSAGSAAVVSGLAYWLIARRLHAHPEDEATIGYGKRLSLLGVIGVVESRVDALLVGSILSFASLAQFRLAETVVDATAKRLWLVISQPFFPRWAAGKRSEALSRFRVDTLLQVLVCGLAFCALFFLVPVLFPLFFTNRYDDAVPLAQILVGASLVSLPGAAVELFLLAQKIEMSQWVLKIATTLVHLGLLPIFMPLWGVKGIALAVLCSRAAYTLVGLVLLRRVFHAEATR